MQKHQTEGARQRTCTMGSNMLWVLRWFQMLSAVLDGIMLRDVRKCISWISYKSTVKVPAVLVSSEYWRKKSLWRISLLVSDGNEPDLRRVHFTRSLCIPVLSPLLPPSLPRSVPACYSVWHMCICVLLCIPVCECIKAWERHQMSCPIILYHIP